MFTDLTFRFTNPCWAADWHKSDSRLVFRKVNAAARTPADRNPGVDGIQTGEPKCRVGIAGIRGERRKDNTLFNFAAGTRKMLILISYPAL